MEHVLYRLKFGFQFDMLGFFVFLFLGVIFFNMKKILINHYPGIDQKGIKDHFFYCVWIVIGKIVGTLAMVGFFALTISYLWEYHLKLDALKREDYFVVEGVVENFHAVELFEHGEEYFTIDGIMFEYSDSETIIGYHKIASLGGVVTHDGQKLKIYYWPKSDRNDILYIAEIE